MSGEPRIASAPLQTKYGQSTFYVFSWSDNEQDNVLALVPEVVPTIPIVRIQSACYSGEIFESRDCDCHWQLETSLSKIHDGGGVFIYMLRDGRGAGLLAKIRGMDLSHRLGIDTADAYEKLGIPLDPRNYDQACYVLNFLGIKTLNLLTNNPRKLKGLEDAGFKVNRMALESDPTDNNREYLRSKAKKLGHLMKSFGTDPSV